MAKIWICPAWAFSSAARRVRMSSALRTKGSMTPVTPQLAATRRFCRSSSVRVGEETSTPGTAMLFRLWSRPPRSTVQWRAVSTAFTRKSSLPSSSSSFCPGVMASKRQAGQGMPPVPRDTCCPSESVSGDASRPMRSSGPCKSIRRVRMPAFWMSSSQSACSASEP